MIIIAPDQRIRNKEGEVDDALANIILDVLDNAPLIEGVAPAISRFRPFSCGELPSAAVGRLPGCTQDPNKGWF